MAVIKEEDDLSEHFTTLNVYNEANDSSYLDPDYASVDERTAETQGSSSDDDSSLSGQINGFEKEEESPVPDVTSSSTFRDDSGHIIVVTIWDNTRPTGGSRRCASR